MADLPSPTPSRPPPEVPTPRAVEAPPTVNRANSTAFCCNFAEPATAAPAAGGSVPVPRAPASEAAGDDGWPRSFFRPDGKEVALLATEARVSMYS